MEIVTHLLSLGVCSERSAACLQLCSQVLHLPARGTDPAQPASQPTVWQTWPCGVRAFCQHRCKPHAQPDHTQARIKRGDRVDTTPGRGTSSLVHYTRVS